MDVLLTVSTLEDDDDYCNPCSSSSFSGHSCTRPQLMEEDRRRMERGRERPPFLYPFRRVGSKKMGPIGTNLGVMSQQDTVPFRAAATLSSLLLRGSIEVLSLVEYPEGRTIGENEKMAFYSFNRVCQTGHWA